MLTYDRSSPNDEFVIDKYKCDGAIFQTSSFGISYFGRNPLIKNMEDLVRKSVNPANKGVLSFHLKASNRVLYLQHW